MHTSKPFRWKQLGLILDPRVRQLVGRIGDKRVRDSQDLAYQLYDENSGRLPGYPSEPPWSFEYGDRRYLLQTRKEGGIKWFTNLFNSAEWMVAVTARQIAKRPSSMHYGFVEYLLTGSNSVNAEVPENIGAADYMWWRLNRYYGINRDDPALFTNELLVFSLDAASLMWNSVEFNSTEEIDQAHTQIIGDIKTIANTPTKTSLAAWAPIGYSAPIELLAVKIRPGRVTEREWWEALSERVSELAMDASPHELRAAFNILDVPGTEPSVAGQSLVLHNLNLMTHLNLAVIDESPWPAKVTDNDPEIQEILENQTLLDWVDHAWSLVSPSSLD